MLWVGVRPGGRLVLPQLHLLSQIVEGKGPVCIDCCLSQKNRIEVIPKSLGHTKAPSTLTTSRARGYGTAPPRGKREPPMRGALLPGIQIQLTSKGASLLSRPTAVKSKCSRPTWRVAISRLKSFPLRWSQGKQLPKRRGVMDVATAVRGCRDTSATELAMSLGSSHPPSALLFRYILNPATPRPSSC